MSGRIPAPVLLRTGGLGIGLAAAVLLPLATGLTLLMADEQRYTPPTFDVAKRLTAGLPWLQPMQWWGVIMLVGVVAMSVGTLLGHLEGLRLALVFGVGFWAFWAGQYLVAVLQSPGASLGEVWVWVFAAMVYAAFAVAVAKAPNR